MGKTKLVNCAMLILLAGIMFTGCSGGGGNQTPSDDDGRKIIEKTIQENSNGCINLLGFKKTDGQKMEVMGVKVYEMQFEAEIKYVKDCHVPRDVSNSELIKNVPEASKPFYVLEEKMAVGWGNYWTKSIPQNHQAKIKGSLRLEKTEKGWAKGIVVQISSEGK